MRDSATGPLIRRPDEGGGRFWSSSKGVTCGQMQHRIVFHKEWLNAKHLTQDVQSYYTEIVVPAMWELAWNNAQNRIHPRKMLNRNSSDEKPSRYWGKFTNTYLSDDFDRKCITCNQGSRYKDSCNSETKHHCHLCRLNVWRAWLSGKSTPMQQRHQGPKQWPLLLNSSKHFKFPSL